MHASITRNGADASPVQNHAQLPGKVSRQQLECWAAISPSARDALSSRVPPGLLLRNWNDSLCMPGEQMFCPSTRLMLAGSLWSFCRRAAGAGLVWLPSGDQFVVVGKSFVRQSASPKAFNVRGNALSRGLAPGAAFNNPERSEGQSVSISVESQKATDSAQVQYSEVTAGVGVEQWPR